jgi:RimJ/RimL family protein N-acetyltransferase
MLQQSVHDTPHIKLVQDVTNMPELMAWADVAIAAGGSTNWELALLGVPTIILVLAENQRPIAEHLQEQDIAINLGWHYEIEENLIQQELTTLLLSHHKRTVMSQSGQNLVDGKGSARVIRHRLDNKVRLRPATQEDDYLLWKWANDPNVRAVSFSTEPIPWDNHLNWLSSTLSNPDRVIYIAIDDKNNLIGQVRFDIENNEATISVSVDHRYRGMGYGSTIIWLASQKLFDNQDVNIIHSYIKPENEISRHSFVKAGFRYNGETVIKENPATHLILCKP